MVNSAGFHTRLNRSLRRLAGRMRRRRRPSDMREPRRSRPARDGLPAGSSQRKLGRRNAGLDMRPFAVAGPIISISTFFTPCPAVFQPTDVFTYWRGRERSLLPSPASGTSSRQAENVSYRLASHRKDQMAVLRRGQGDKAAHPESLLQPQDNVTTTGTGAGSSTTVSQAMLRPGGSAAIRGRPTRPCANHAEGS